MLCLQAVECSRKLSETNGLPDFKVGLLQANNISTVLCVLQQPCFDGPMITGSSAGIPEHGID